MKLSWACVFFMLISTGPAIAAEIHDAARAGDLALVEQLLSASPGLATAADERACTPLHFAMDTGQLAVGELLLSNGADLMALDADGDSPLHWAAIAGQPEAVNWLISSGAELDAANNQLQTPLHYAVFRNHHNAAEALLLAGASVAAQDVDGETALIGAAMRADAEMIALLLTNGADLEQADNYQRTPLLLVARETGDAVTARVLIANNANIDARDRYNDTSLNLAAWRGFTELVNLLLENGAEIDAEVDGMGLFRNSAEMGLDRLFFHLVRTAERLGEDPFDESVLFLAATGGSPAIIGEILEHGVAPDVVDHYGWTPLHYAAKKGRIAVIRELVAGGGDIDGLNKLGQSAYNLAVLWDKGVAAAELLELGANSAPQQFPQLSGLYFGQEPPGLEPEVFGLGIVNGPEMEHTCISFSPDGQEAFWPTSLMLEDSGYSVSKIMTAREVDGAWSAPELTDFTREETFGEGDPFFAPSGERVYFYSRRPYTEGGPVEKENIWYIAREQDGWSAPQSLTRELNALDMHWQIGADLEGNLYFGAVDGRGQGGGDIYMAPFNGGNFAAPENLGPPVSTAADEGMPYIAPDGSYLLFSRQGAEDSLGGHDIYISRREPDGAWAEAQNMGPLVNSAGNDICPQVTPDGKYLFWLGNQAGVGGMLWISSEAIPLLGE